MPLQTRLLAIPALLGLATIMSCVPPPSTDLQSNKEIVRRFIAETNAQNFSAYDELLTGDLVQHFPGGIDKDRQVVEENERMLATAFPDIFRTIEDLIAEGNKVVARTSLRGTHLGDFGGISATGRPIDRSSSRRDPPKITQMGAAKRRSGNNLVAFGNQILNRSEYVWKRCCKHSFIFFNDLPIFIDATRKVLN